MSRDIAGLAWLTASHPSSDQEQQGHLRKPEGSSFVLLLDTHWGGFAMPSDAPEERCSRALVSLV